jgi:plastocyanin
MRFTYICLIAALAVPAIPAGAAQTYTVHVKDFAFKPSTLTIDAGDTVTFVNDDSDAHTVTASDKSFDSAGLDTNDTWTHTFSKAGTFTYFCALHPYMKGTIVVRSSGGGAR